MLTEQISNRNGDVRQQYDMFMVRRHLVFWVQGVPRANHWVFNTFQTLFNAKILENVDDEQKELRRLRELDELMESRQKTEKGRVNVAAEWLSQCDRGMKKEPAQRNWKNTLAAKSEYRPGTSLHGTLDVNSMPKLLFVSHGTWCGIGGFL